MRIFKHKRRNEQGQVVESEHWYYRIRFAGREKLVCTETTDEAIAQRRANLAEEQLQQMKSTLRESPETSLRLCDVVQREVKRITKEVSEGQGERTGDALRNFREWAGDTCSIETITPAMVDSYQDKRIVDGVSRETMHKELGAIARMLRHEGMQFPAIKNRADKEGTVREFTQEELLRFFTAAEGTVFYRLWLFLMMTGRRLAELVPSSHKAGHSNHQPLLKEEIDLEQRTIKVRLAKRRRGQKVKVRVSGIPDEMVPVVEAQIAATPPEYPYVFPKMFGIPRAFDATLKRAGIPKRDTLGQKLVAHSLRHTWISMTYEQTLDPILLKELTGHSSSKTLERYIHLKPQANPISMAAFVRNGGNSFRPETPEVIDSQNADIPVIRGA